MRASIASIEERAVRASQPNRFSAVTKSRPDANGTGRELLIKGRD